MNLLNTLAPSSQPAFELTINGEPKDFGDRLIRLTLRDLRGFEADQLEIVLDDADGALALPPTGAVIALKLGWPDEGLVDKGTFTVNGVAHGGPPDTLTIRASSADMRAELKAQKTKSWDQVTLGDIVTTIATAHNLTPAVGDDLKSIAIQHIDQTDESDAHFLTRLAVDYDAIATVKAGRLLFVRAGASRTTSGAALSPVTIARSDGDTHSYDASDRDAKYDGVKARWIDTDAAIAKTVLVGANGNCKTLRKTYRTESEAANAANAEWRRISRAAASMSLTLARGNPELMPEIPGTLAGWKPEIDAQSWVVSEATHTLDNGLTTALSLETASPT